MEKLIAKYINKLHSHELADKDKVVFIALDDRLFSSNAIKNVVPELSKIFEIMNINSILFGVPAEPYRSIINELTENDNPNQKSISYGNKHRKSLKRLTPMDCETRTFLHDIPIVEEFTSTAIAEALSERKSAIVKGHGIISYGTVTPEQAFVSYSSTCFSVYVKYFFDSINYFKHCFLNKIFPNKRYIDAFKKIAEYAKGHLSFDSQRLDEGIETNSIGFLGGKYNFAPAVTKKPESEQEVIRMLAETGMTVVKLHLVDSYFGNISYVFGDNIFISQTGSSLDELEGCIDSVPLNGTSSVGITSSSELSTHKRIYYEIGHNAILHAHPRFSVIMSMFCPLSDCPHFTNRIACHVGCSERRYIAGIPVVPGEIGTGHTGIVNTVPLAIKEAGGVIVYGHGVFTSGKEDFSGALALLLDIEGICKEEYFRKISYYLNH